MFYENGEVVCPSCEGHCVTCETTALNCLSCTEESNRVPPKCDCDTGFYEVDG